MVNILFNLHLLKYKLKGNKTTDGQVMEYGELVSNVI